MKKIDILYITVIVIATLFTAIIITACTKSSTNPCNGVTCLNGGACDKGICICPTGYTGTYCQTTVTSSVTYTNTTYTPILITSNGNTSTIPVGGNVTYSGTYGTSTNANAYTSGLSSTGTQFGLKITWSLSDPFPASGTSNINLYVNSNDFYLYIINNNASYATNTLYVNYSLTAQTVDYVDVPNNGVKYGIGYYSAYTNTEIYILSNPTGTSWTNYPSFSFITNQYYTITLY